MASMPEAPGSAQEYGQQVQSLQNKYNSVLNEYHSNKTPNNNRDVQEWANVLESYVSKYQDRF